MRPNSSLNVPVADDVISLADDVISDAGDVSSEYTKGQMITIVVIVAMVMAFIIVGNPRNAFIVSLAVSDVMVGATIMPFSLSNELLGYWAFGKILCDLWLAFDVIAFTASIYNLCAIALDRYWSVTDASYVQYKSRGRMKNMIAAVWISALAVGLPPLVGWAEEQDWEHTDKPFCELRTLPEYVFFSVALSFWVPLLLMVAVYCVVLRETKKRFAARRQRRKVSEEVIKRYGLRGAQHTAVPDTRIAKNASKAASADSAKGSMHKLTKSLVPAVLFKFCFWLGYCNSCLNPVIYTSFNQDFKEAYSEVYRKFRPRTPEGRRF
ncbi:ADRA1D [Branchiostoma lanceolatum]|uniref:ADRA1D protein n=1 Tax=Branchiostoma lanceolatum TaxID=7740 RepID=A0A8J9VD07_BRALA|nr:ADRA1D [Branchiostoma lanceolatum]